MKTNTKGLLWILGPWISLIVTLMIWGIASFVFSGLLTSGATSALGVARLINIMLGFVGILSILMIPVGVIVGIIILVKGKQPPATPQPPVV